MFRSYAACDYTFNNHSNLIRYVNKCSFARGEKRKIRSRHEFYLENEEISRIRNAVSDDDMTKSGKENDLDVKTYDDYLNNMNLQHHDADKEDSRRKICKLSLFVFNLPDFC